MQRTASALMRLDLALRNTLQGAGREDDRSASSFMDRILRTWFEEYRYLAGVDGLPILDWFHVAMRLQHLKQVPEVCRPTVQSVRPRRR
jgi:hypothetical protein